MTSDADRFDAVKRWTTHGVVVEDVTAPAGVRLRGHGHGEPHLCFVVAGSFEERDRRCMRLVEPGTLRLSPAGDEHDIRFGQHGGRCLLVLVRQSLLESGFVRGPVDRRFIQGAGVAAAAERIGGILRSRRDEVSPLDLELSVLEVMARTPGTRADALESRPPRWLHRLRDAIHAASSPNDVTALVAAVDRHPVYVARAFRRWYGTGPVEYARTLRLERARSQVLFSDRPLARIAAEAGYADQSHLTRTFRSRLGVTPGSLRDGAETDIQVCHVLDGGRPAGE